MEPFNLWKLIYLSDYVLPDSRSCGELLWSRSTGRDESLHYALDWDLLIRLGKRFGLFHTPEY